MIKRLDMPLYIHKVTCVFQNWNRFLVLGKLSCEKEPFSSEKNPFSSEKDPFSTEKKTLSSQKEPQMMAVI
jgi:hypothetical protein